MRRFNNTTTEFPRGKTLIQLFEEQVERIPNAAAISLNGQELTYRELNERVNRLARTLRSHGISKDVWSPLWLSVPSKWLWVCWQHTKPERLRPIHPEYPEERIRFLIEDSGAQVMLTQSRLRERLAGLTLMIYWMTSPSIMRTEQT